MCPLLQSFITIIITSHRASRRKKPPRCLTNTLSECCLIINVSSLVRRGPFCHAPEKSRSPSLTKRIAASGNEIATLLVSVTVSVFVWWGRLPSLEDQRVTLWLVSTLRPFRHGWPYQEYKTPADVALWIIETRKLSHHDKVVTPFASKFAF